MLNIQHTPFASKLSSGLQSPYLFLRFNLLAQGLFWHKKNNSSDNLFGIFCAILTSDSFLPFGDVLIG